MKKIVFSAITIASLLSASATMAGRIRTDWNGVVLCGEDFSANALPDA